MSRFMKNLNYYKIKFLLKINKLMNQNSLNENEGCCAFGDIKNKLHCKKIFIQLCENDNIDELFRILPLLVNHGIEIELIEFDKVLEKTDIRKLKQISPNIKVNFRYMLSSYYSGENVEQTYNMEDYSKILEKIEYLTKTAKMNFSSIEEQVMFIINQLSEYISFYDKYDELNEEQFKETSSLKGALLERETVCIGYAMAFERCMNDLNIESMIIQGDGYFDREPKNLPWEHNHAWNLVKIKGKWYNVDVTWLSTIKSCYRKDKEINKAKEKDTIEKYILSDDNSFENHCRLEDYGIICEEALKGRFQIYEKVKKYKNVLEEYDKGKRNNMLQIKLEYSSPNGRNQTEQDLSSNNKQIIYQDVEK